MGNKSTVNEKFNEQSQSFTHSRYWNTFVIFFYGYMSCTGDDQHRFRRNFEFDTDIRTIIKTLMSQTDKYVLRLIYEYMGTTKIRKKKSFGYSFGGRTKIENTGMVFKEVKQFNKQKQTVPGYIHYTSRGFGGNKPIVGINNSVKSIKKYEIRCVGVYESDAGKHGHGKKRVAGPIDIYLKPYGNKWDKPLILHLNSYEPVIWRIHATKKVVKNCKLQEIFVSCYYANESRVELNDGLKCNDILIENDDYQGYGEDDGGGETDEMLANIMYEYGDKPLSMIGIYHALKFDVYVGNKHKFVK
eukprot:425554_1